VVGDIRQVQPDDDEIQEEWLRETDEPDIGTVSAARVDEIGGWLVAIWTMEMVRSDPLEVEIRQRVTSALRGVRGVTSADEHDNEQWFVTGNTSGPALLEAAAQVVDDLADQIRAYISRIDGS
jgi:hypothetical protein